MSKDKNSVSPFTDKEYLQSSSSANNKYKKQVTKEDINEFEEVFSDEEAAEKKGTDGKGFFASFRTSKDAPQEKAPEKTALPKTSPRVRARTVPVPPVSPASKINNDSIYEQQSVDIDAFMKTLSTSPYEKEKKSAPEIKVTDASPKTDEAEKTMNITLKKAQKKPAASQKTRYFNLSDAVKEKIKKSVPAPDERTNIIKGVRVLSSGKPSDEAIIEATPSGDGKESLLDSVSPEKGEDIFAAVDKAVKHRKNQGFNVLSAEEAKKKAKKKREEEIALTGKALRDSLVKNSKIARIQLIITAVLFVISLIFAVLPNFHTDGNSLQYMFANGGRVYALLNLLVTALLVPLFFKDYKNSVISIADMKPDRNLPLTVVTFYAMVYDIALLILGSAGHNGMKMFTMVPVFAAGAHCISEYFKNQTALRSIRTAMKTKDSRSLAHVDNKADANALAQGISDKGDPRILYCNEKVAVSSFAPDKSTDKKESRYQTFSSIAVILSGFIMATVLCFKNKDAGIYMSTLLSAICLCTPILGNTLRTVNLYFENLSLNKIGAATDKDGIRNVGEANGIVTDISDIFSCEVSRFKLVPGVYMNKNDAAVYTAAVTVAANTLTGICFKDFTEQMEIQLPEAEDLRYEEYLGYTAWVGEKMILVGNREMLVQHSIPAPSESDERSYAKNKFVMYLAVDGQLTASFLVNYKVLSKVKKISADFNKTGLVLMLTSKEPCLSQSEISKRLSLDAAGVKVLSTKGCDIVSEYKNSPVDKSSGLFCPRKGNSLLPVIVSAHRLYVSDKLLFNLQLLGQSAGMLLLALSLLLNMPLFRNPLTIIILHTLWNIGSYFLCSKTNSTR